MSSRLSCLNPQKGFLSSVRGFVRHEDADSLGSIAVRCGKCEGCRSASVMAWSTRVRHEAMMHDHVSVVHLTYSDENLPDDGSLSRAHLSQFFNGVHHRFGTCRHFGCGEYGDRNERAHYHTILFGPDIPDRVPFKRGKSGQTLFSSESLSAAWKGRGHVLLEDFHHGAAAYIAAYILKKHVPVGDPNGFYTAVDPATGAYVRKVAPFLSSSKAPAIGDLFFFKYRKSIYAPGGIILDGRPCPPVHRYDLLLQEHFPDEWEKVFHERLNSAGLSDLDEKVRAARSFQYGRLVGLNSADWNPSRDGFDD